MLWAELRPPIRMLRCKSPVPQNVTVFGDIAFNEIIKAENKRCKVKCVLIQYG